MNAPKRTVYLIRHAEADTGFGRKRVCLGRKDVPLSHEGEKQALRLAQFFKGKTISGIYTSPLKRCRDTARMIAEKSGHKEVPVHVVEAFTEVDTGEWDGRTFSEIQEKDPEGYAERGQHLGTYVIAGGESLLKAGERFLEAFQKMLAESDGDLLVVAHSGVIRAFLCLLTGTDIDCLRDFHVPCASVTELEIEKDLYEKKDLYGKAVVQTVGLRPVESIALSEVDRIWAECQVTPQQRLHMEAVADLAMNLIGYEIALVRSDLIDTAWKYGNGTLNVRAIYYAALLHDIKRSDGGRVHAANGAAYLEKEGYQELAELVRMHHDPGVYRSDKPLSEAEILYYADKLVEEDRMVSLEERFANSRKKCASEEALKNHEAQYQAALGIQRKIF